MNQAVASLQVLTSPSPSRFYRRSRAFISFIAILARLTRGNTLSGYWLIATYAHYITQPFSAASNSPETASLVALYSILSLTRGNISGLL